MCYRYIALMDMDERDEAAGRAPLESGLVAIGMKQCAAARGFRLYASEQTPVMQLQDGGVIVGHVFDGNGKPLTSARRLGRLPHSEDVRRYLIDHFWGDYVLMHPSHEDPSALSILRDPGGGVGCLYHVEAGRGFVTSDIELPARLGLHRNCVDWDSIVSRLSYPELKTARTCILGLRELLPGTALIVRRPSVRIVQEWSPWSFVKQQQRHTCLEDATADVRHAVELAVNSWAQTDASVLLELSGGLDSSVVGICLQHSGVRVACATLLAASPGGDERNYGNPVAASLGVSLDALQLSPEQAAVSFPLPPYFASPRIGVLQRATDELMGRAQDCHQCTSFFSGGGGDSVFCYLSSAAPAADAFKGAGIAAGLTAIRDLSDLHGCDVWTAARLALLKLLRRPRPHPRTDHLFLTIGGSSPPPELHPWLAAPDGALYGDRERIAGLATTQVYRDGAFRGSRWHLRLPLLSQPVLEACLRAPSWMWIAGGQNRAVARRAFADVLPPNVLHRRSKGSFIGFLGAWYDENKERIRDYLLSGQLRAHGVLDARALGDFIDADLVPRDRAFTRVLDLCTVENWVRNLS